MKLYDLRSNTNYIESVTYYPYSGNQLGAGQSINKVVIRQYSGDYQDNRPGISYFAHIDIDDMATNPLGGWLDVDSDNQYKITEAYLTGVGNIDQYWSCKIKKMKRV